MENKDKKPKLKKAKKPITVKEEQDKIYSDLKEDIKDSIDKMDDIIDEKDK